MKKNTEFSKKLLRQESILIWITTLSMIALAFICIKNQYFGELPWLAAMVGFPWTAYGVSQACYYKKAMAEALSRQSILQVFLFVPIYFTSFLFVELL